MVTPKKPSGKALAPSIDQWQKAYNDAESAREEEIPEGAFTINELCEKLNRTKWGVLDFVKERIATGEVKRILVKRLDLAGRLRSIPHYRLIDPKS